MKVSIFARSYSKDFEWLAYCLRSLAKRAHGFYEIVVCVPKGQTPPTGTNERVIYVHAEGNQYLQQQRDKLVADLHCSGDLILHIDSDVVLKKDVTPETFMRDGKPLWFWRPWKDCAPDEKKAWLHVVTKCLQDFAPGEFMRKNTTLVPRFAYKAFRDFIQETHGIDMTSYVMNQPGNEFSEYNCLGAYLHKYHHHAISWHNESVDGIPEPFERQFWSHSGLTPEIRAELEAILA